MYKFLQSIKLNYKQLNYIMNNCSKIKIYFYIIKTEYEELNIQFKLLFIVL